MDDSKFDEGPEFVLTAINCHYNGVALPGFPGDHFVERVRCINTLWGLNLG